MSPLKDARLLAEAAERGRLKACSGLEQIKATLSHVAADRDAWESRACKEATRVVELEQQRDALLAALESLVLFTDPKKSNAVALNNAFQAIAAAKGGDV